MKRKKNLEQMWVHPDDKRELKKRAAIKGVTIYQELHNTLSKETEKMVKEGFRFGL